MVSLSDGFLGTVSAGPTVPQLLDVAGSVHAAGGASLGPHGQQPTVVPLFYHEFSTFLASAAV